MVNISIEKFILILSFGLLVNVHDVSLFADASDVSIEPEKGILIEGYGTDFEDDFLDLDDIRAWEEKNPPSFFKVTGAFIKEHISKNKVAYLLGAAAVGALGYYFRKHLCAHKYKYLLGTTATATLAGLYGKWQFDKVMNKAKRSYES